MCTLVSHTLIKHALGQVRLERLLVHTQYLVASIHPPFLLSDAMNMYYAIYYVTFLNQPPGEKNKVLAVRINTRGHKICDALRRI